MYSNMEEKYKEIQVFYVIPGPAKSVIYTYNRYYTQLHELKLKNINMNNGDRCTIYNVKTSGFVYKCKDGIDSGRVLN